MIRIKEWLGSDSSFEDADTSDPWFVRHEQISEGAHTDQSQSKNFQQTNQGKINEAKH